LSKLETKLDELDRKETISLHLASMRMSTDGARQALLLEIDRELAEYGKT
jgi:hypothetical protein